MINAKRFYASYWVDMIAPLVVAIRYSQVDKRASPLNWSMERYTCINTSCATSSASSWFCTMPGCSIKYNVPVVFRPIVWKPVHLLLLVVVSDPVRSIKAGCKFSGTILQKQEAFAPSTKDMVTNSEYRSGSIETWLRVVQNIYRIGRYIVHGMRHFTRGNRCSCYFPFRQHPCSRPYYTIILNIPARLYATARK